LGTEGAGDADVGIRDSINRGLIPGPRLFVATQPLATSGSYAIRHESSLNGTVVPPISDACDGVDGVTAGVRRRLGVGADLIKFYADYRRRTLRYPPPAYPGGKDILYPPAKRLRNPSRVMFNQAEMSAICAEARLARAPVAAHATEPEAVIMAAKAGVTTIEHGFVPSSSVTTCLLTNRTIFVPTLSVLELFKGELKDGGLGGSVTWESVLAHTGALWSAGVRIAAGGDAGAFAHGDNAREIELLVEAGLPIEAALQAATIRGWEACGGDLDDTEEGEAVVGRKFGSVQPGWAADLVAISGDPRTHLGALRQVKWVIKDGQFVVRDGQIVGPWD
jgi:imidazolonepropionase-like amidohydrolase